MSRKQSPAIAATTTPTQGEVIRFHWNHAMAYPKTVIGGFLSAIISLVLERYISALFVASLLANIQAGTATLESSIWLLVGYGAILLVAVVIGYRVNLYTMWGIQVRGAQKIYNQGFDHLTKHSIGFFGDTFTGSLVSQASKLATSFISFWNMVIFQVLFAVTSIVATLIGVGILMWQYAIVLLVLITVYIAVAYFGSRFLRPRQRARSKAYTDISAQLADAVGNMSAVKTDSRERFEKSRLAKTVATMVEKEWHVRRGIMQVTTSHAIIISFMRIAALLVSVLSIEYGAMSAAFVYLALTYTINLVDELGRINETFRMYYQIVGDSEEMIGIMKQPIEVHDVSRKKLRVTNGAITFDAVEFSYQQSNEVALKKLNLAIAGGERIGLVGPSGAGKSTIAKLLIRLIDPTSGAITIDGQDIKTVSQTSLHQAISYVPQDPALFHRSIRENISYGKPNAKEADIITAAKQANAFDFIQKLPQGLDTMVGERGVKLSGGQRQRIAIARALLKDAPILILDEATSALDSESEHLIQQALKRLMKNRTSIVIAHRLSTIAQLDRIVVLDKGAITEEGTHKQLLANEKLYARLWAHQSGGFIEE